MTAYAVRIYRWADAPEDLRTALDPTGTAALDWLAQVPPQKREEQLGVDWVDVQEIELEDETLLVGGKDKPV